MKNLSTIIAILTLLFLLSCNNSQKDSPEVLRKKTIEDSLYKVRKDSLDKVEAERLAYLNRPWKVNTFVDNFGDPTGEKYIQTQVEGYFSNSATSNLYMFSEVILKKNAAGIFLHLYRKNTPAEKFIGSVQIQMKNVVGKKLIINTSGEWSQKGGIKIDNNIGGYYHWDFSKFKKFIQKSIGSIKVVIFDDYSGVYNFKLDATGFNKEFSKL
ncbi:MAG: hypothetical protein IIC75_08310 [Bacteroidetes bacterium]|nr:hypothetical protein [Bacteroidota bacterium]